MLPYHSYFAPQVRNVEVIRCNADGEAAAGGSYMRIKARRYYCNYYMTDEYPFVTCIVRYRFRPLTSAVYSAWTEILGADADTDLVDTDAMALGLDAEEDYEVVVGVLDSKGTENSTSIILHAGGVFLHRDGTLNSIGIGEEVKTENTVSVAPNIDVRVKKSLSVGTGGSAGDTSMTDHHFSMRGDGYGEVHSVVPDDAETAGSGSAYTSVSHALAGSITSKCQSNGEANPGSVTIEMENRYANTGLQLGLVGDRAFLAGLTGPVGNTDAANKKYVDDGLAGKAPAGFGLGETVKWIYAPEKLADYIHSGFYSWASGVSDAPFNAGSMIVIKRSELYVYQVAFRDDITRVVIAVRKLTNTTWSEWVDYSPSAFAPAGFGLGTTTQKAPNDDPNQITKTGFYSAQHSNLAPGSSGRSYILHIECTSDYAIQFQYDLDTSLQAVRRKLAGVWQAWVDCSPSAFAPAGYGLGTTGKVKSIQSAADLDTIKTNGWYAIYAPNGLAINGVSFTSVTLEVSMYNDNYGHQTLRHLGDNKTLRRAMSGGTWKAWEFVGAGVEFDTGAINVASGSTWPYNGNASKFYNVTVQIGSTAYRHTFVVDWAAVNSASNKQIGYYSDANGNKLNLVVKIDGTSISFKPSGCNIVHIRGYY